MKIIPLKKLKSDYKKVNGRSFHFGKFDFNQITHKVKKFVKENKKAIGTVVGTAAVVGGSALVLHKRTQAANKLLTDELKKQKASLEENAIAMQSNISNLQGTETALKHAHDTQEELFIAEKKKTEIQIKLNKELEQRITIADNLLIVEKSSKTTNSNEIHRLKILKKANEKTIADLEQKLNQANLNVKEKEAVAEVDVNANAQALENAQMEARDTLGDYEMEEGVSNLKNSSAATTIQAHTRKFLQKRKAKMQLALTKQEPVDIREILQRQGYDVNTRPGTDIGLTKDYKKKRIEMHPDKKGKTDEANKNYQNVMSDYNKLKDAGYFFGKKVKISLKKMCKRYHIRLTVKRGSKRVPKSEKVLKSQLKNKMKKNVKM